MTNLSPQQFQWRVTEDRFGGRTEVANTEHGGYSIDGNGAGKNRWTVAYPDGDYGMTSTKGEARAWAAEDHAWRDRSKR